MANKRGAPGEGGGAAEAETEVRFMLAHHGQTFVVAFQGVRAGGEQSCATRKRANGYLLLDSWFGEVGESMGQKLGTRTAGPSVSYRTSAQMVASGPGGVRNRHLPSPNALLHGRSETALTKQIGRRVLGPSRHHGLEGLGGPEVALPSRLGLLR